jgi:hypothetical protein
MNKKKQNKKIKNQRGVYFIFVGRLTDVTILGDICTHIGLNFLNATLHNRAATWPGS